MIQKKFCIYGIGGFGREVLCTLIDVFKTEGKTVNSSVVFTVDDFYFSEPIIMGIPVIPYSKINYKDYKFLIAVGDPNDRKQIVESMPSDTEFATIIHPSVVLSKWVTIGEGSIITAGCVLTSQISLGKQTHLNLRTTIGHDCILGDYFTTAPGVAVSGYCKIAQCVYIGTNAAIRDRINICSDVTVGMGAMVVKSITHSGVYVGNPAKLFYK